MTFDDFVKAVKKYAGEVPSFAGLIVEGERRLAFGAHVNLGAMAIEFTRAVYELSTRENTIPPNKVFEMMAAANAVTARMFNVSYEDIARGFSSMEAIARDGKRHLRHRPVGGTYDLRRAFGGCQSIRNV